MCDIKKAQQMVNEIDDALHSINARIGTSTNLGYSFFPDKLTGEIRGISLTIPAGPNIDPVIPATVVNWRPKKIEEELLPIFQKLANA